jgi:hypothetical protein
MSDLLQHKPVNNRKTRPVWAMDDKQLMLRCVGTRHMLRFKIAQMYWKQNMTAADIATALDMSTNAVELVILRLSRTK